MPITNSWCYRPAGCVPKVQPMDPHSTLPPSTSSPLAASQTPYGTALRHADSDADLLACWPVVHQLRPRLQSAEDFIARVHRMRADHYRILAAWQDNHTAVALGGYRLAENLIYGRFLYVDDLVTLDTARGARWGQALMDAMARIGENAGCSCLVLDTGLSNALAQRFYFRQGLLTQAMRFGRPLQSAQNGGGAAA